MWGPSPWALHLTGLGACLRLKALLLLPHAMNGVLGPLVPPPRPTLLGARSLLLLQERGHGQTCVDTTVTRSSAAAWAQAADCSQLPCLQRRG